MYLSTVQLRNGMSKLLIEYLIGVENHIAKLLMTVAILMSLLSCSIT